MLEAFKAAGAFANLLRNKEQVIQAVARGKSELEAKRVTGEGGGGKVKVTVNGRLRVVEMHIDPSMLGSADKDRELCKQIITDAVNKALAKAVSTAGKQIAAEMEKLGLPPVPGLEGLKG